MQVISYFKKFTIRSFIYILAILLLIVISVEIYSGLTQAEKRTSNLNSRGPSSESLTSESLTIENRSQGSNHVIYGKVIDTKSSWQEASNGDTLIITKVKVQILEKLKGGIDSQKSIEDTIEFEIAGGTVGNFTVDVANYPKITKGERMVVFLRESEDKQYTPFGQGAGILKLDKKSVNKKSKLSLSEIRKRVTSSKSKL